MNASTNADWEQLFLTKFQFILWGIIGLAIAIAGLLGNIVTMAVLMKNSMRNSTGIYLLVLATFDIIVLVTFIVIFSLPLIVPQLTALMTPPSFLVSTIYPVSLTAQTVTVYITVGFTMERYIAIRYPFKAAHWCTRNKAKRIATCIILCSTAYNVPRMLEDVSIYGAPGRTSLQTNGTMLNNSYQRLGENELYGQVYNVYMYPIFMFFIPFVLLFVLNFLLLFAVRRSSTQTRASRFIGQQRRSDTNLTIMLISVVVVFLVCQAFALVDNILISFLPKSVTYTFNYFVFYVVTQVMVLINSAINFVMYCLFGKKFRQTLLLISCRIIPRSENSSRYATINNKSDIELRNRAV